MIFDKDGNRISNEKFLGSLKKKTNLPDLWIDNCNVANDGYIYATGTVNQHVYLAREDGNILVNLENADDSIHCYLYGNCYEIYRNDTGRTQAFTYEGIEINPDGSNIRQNNDSYIDCEKEKFTVYSRNTKLSYTVNDKDYDPEGFSYTEGMTTPELTQYQIKTNDDNYVYRTSFLGIRQFDDYVHGTKVGDYYIVQSWDMDGTTHCLVMDSKGKDVYVGKPGEEIEDVLLGKEMYLYVKEGNYSGVKNLQGKYLYRQLANEMEDD